MLCFKFYSFNLTCVASIVNKWILLQGMAILGAALRSSSVLTDVFLGNTKAPGDA
uniref:Uncharacterized protein n=1 Tax=Arundo donax TaxID=35708 RepID=A0A0A8YLJ5_ARUDO